MVQKRAEEGEQKFDAEEEDGDIVKTDLGRDPGLL